MSNYRPNVAERPAPGQWYDHDIKYAENNGTDLNVFFYGLNLKVCCMSLHKGYLTHLVSYHIALYSLRCVAVVKRCVVLLWCNYVYCRDCNKLFYTKLWCLILSYPLLLCPILCYPVLLCPVLSCCVLLCPVLLCPILSCSVVLCPILSCSVVLCPVVSCPVLWYPVVSCPVLCCAILSSSFVSCPILFCAVLICMLDVIVRFQEQVPEFGSLVSNYILTHINPLVNRCVLSLSCISCPVLSCPVLSCPVI